MQLHTSYDTAFKAALASQTFAIARLQHIKLPMNIDTSGCYKLFYFISGAKKFHIDHYIYNIEPGDLFFVNQREWHYFSQINEEDSHERIVIFIYPEFLKALCTDATDLCSCFTHKTDALEHKLRLQPKDRDKLSYLIHKFTAANGYGEDIFVLSIFLELMVFVNRACHQQHQTQTATEPSRHTATTLEASLSGAKQISPILSFIDSHITEDLSLELLSRQFYVTPSYLCRIFKNGTGTTVHKYITAKRITLAKDLLTQGYSVTDACNMSGFKDYNGFLKSFVSAVGIAPKKYAQFGE